MKIRMLNWTWKSTFFWVENKYLSLDRNRCWRLEFKPKTQKFWKFDELIFCQNGIFSKTYHSILYSTQTKLKTGDIDVGEICWRRNMLVTYLRSWWPIWPLSPLARICQHSIFTWVFITNIQKMSPSTWFCRQHHSSLGNH